MADMIERVARAMCIDAGENPDAFMDVLPDGAPEDREPFWKEWSYSARAAIAAMRDPSERMSYVGGIAFENAAFGQSKLVFDGAADAWRAMIDEALEPTPAADVEEIRG